MKSITKTLLAGLALFPIASVITACSGEEIVDINQATVDLSYTQVEYNGAAKCPKVVVSYKGKIIDAKDYVVTYDQNVDAGTAYVYVRALVGSKHLVGDITLNFTITQTNAYVNTYHELITSLDNHNYNTIVLEDDITVPYGYSFMIDVNKTLDLGEYNLINYGDVQNFGTILTSKKIAGSGTFANEGDIVANVSSVEDMLEAFEYSNYIKLAQDITKEDGYLGDIRFIAKHDYDFTLDLNGHILESELDIFKYEKNGNAYTHYNKEVNITITDTSELKNGCLGSEESDYGLYVWGGDKYNINIVNATLQGGWGGIYTNGNATTATTRITATSSKFQGLSEDGFGAYIAADYIYNFTDCEFSGVSGFYAKSGNITFNDCSFIATGDFAEASYSGNGANSTGAAINIDSCYGYKQNLDVTINGGVIQSLNGYGIYEFSTAANSNKVSYSSVTVTGDVEYSTFEANIQSDNDTVTVQ